MKVNKKWVLPSLERNTIRTDILPHVFLKSTPFLRCLQIMNYRESVPLSQIFQACISSQRDNFNARLLLSITLYLHFFSLFPLPGIKYAGHFTSCCQNNPNSPEQGVYGNAFIGAAPIASPGLALPRPLHDLNLSAFKTKKATL